MLQKIKKFLGIGPSVDFEELISNGGIIVDVRSRDEYSSGHVKGSHNIPLNQIGTIVNKVKSKDQAIITCCASGMRSASAKSSLKMQGYTNVHNGGSWSNLKKYGK